MSDNTNENKSAYAVSLAEAGFWIFPLRPGSRRPFEGVSWSSEMTQDKERIRRWLTDNPAWNYGVCPGENYVVLDLDEKADKHGINNFLKLEKEQDVTEWISGNATFTVETPNGGLHYYIGVPEAQGNAHSFPDFIDVRGARGYVVGPGCVVEEGEYTPTTGVKFCRAPDWALQRMGPQRKRDEDRDQPLFELDLPAAVERAREFLSTRGPAIEGHNGNDHTFATAAQVKDLGVSEEQCVALMLEPGGWNTKCSPPWETAELAEVVNNAYKYGADRPGAKGGSLLEQYEAVMGLSDPSGESDQGYDKYASLREITYTAGDILKRNKRREMIVPEWLPAHGFLALLAHRGGGKTAIMVDMALRLALDMDWHGLPVSQGWYVVYLCGEDDEGAEEQIRAWCHYHNVPHPPERFVFLEGVVDLMSAGETQFWTEYLYHDVMAGDPNNRAVLFVDTWQRATSRGTQNDDAEMQLAVHHIEAMAESLNGPASVAFHPPKHDKNMVMGSSVIENSSTAIWTLEEQANGRRLEVSRIKGKGIGNYKLLQFEEIGLGEYDDFGRERTGVVPATEGGTGVNMPEDRMEAQKQALARAIAVYDLVWKSHNPEKGPLTQKEAAQGLAQIMGHKIDESEWPDAGAVREALVQSGFHPVGVEAFEEVLYELMVEDPRPQPIGDGTTVKVDRSGRQAQFKIHMDNMGA